MRDVLWRAHGAAGQAASRQTRGKCQRGRRRLTHNQGGMRSFNEGWCSILFRWPRSDLSLTAHATYKAKSMLCIQSWSTCGGMQRITHGLPAPRRCNVFPAGAPDHRTQVGLEATEAPRRTESRTSAHGASPILWFPLSGARAGALRTSRRGLTATYFSNSLRAKLRMGDATSGLQTPSRVLWSVTHQRRVLIAKGTASRWQQRGRPSPRICFCPAGDQGDGAIAHMFSVVFTFRVAIWLLTQLRPPRTAAT